MRFKHQLTSALAGAAFIAIPALAADPADLSEGAPLVVDDTRVTEAGKRTYQVPLVLERTGNDAERVRLEPQLKMGIAPNWQATVAVPIIMGSASRAGSGDIRLGLQGRFNEDAGLLPSFGASLRLSLPTGRDSEGLDSRLKLLATKTVAPGQRIHANALLENNQDASPTQRRNRRGFVLGYDIQLQSETVLVADYVYEHARERGRHDRLLQAGLRQKVGEGVVGLGLGAGLGDSATDWRLALSWQGDF